MAPSPLGNGLLTVFNIFSLIQLQGSQCVLVEQPRSQKLERHLL
jgi:hypothetical protein